MLSLAAAAHATEPTSDASAQTNTAYASITLTEAKPAAQSPLFQGPPLPPHPLRASLVSNELAAVGQSNVSPRPIRVVLDTESVASFPIDDASSSDANALPQAPRLPSIRKRLDDDDGVFEHIGATRRLIRRTLDDSNDLASVSVARRLRSTLD
ncbi:MAG: hypothetical protein QM756_05830 [Polyangiaceae bacterium]